MRIALPRWRNAGLGRQRLTDHLRTVQHLTAAAPLDLIVFPELSLCGYPVDAGPNDNAAIADVAQPLESSAAVQRLAELAAQVRCAVVFGMAEAVDGVVYDSVVMADATGTVSSYRKVHLTDGERRIFAPGDRAVVVRAVIGAEPSPITVGLSSCFDKQFPAVYQQQRELGARLSIISSAWSSSVPRPGRGGGREDVLAMQSSLFDRARAAETGMVVVSTNFLGLKRPGSLASFCGGARVVDPLGREIAPDPGAPGRRTWDVDLLAMLGGRPSAIGGDPATPVALADAVVPPSS